jgi:hypothetical protein
MFLSNIIFWIFTYWLSDAPRGDSWDTYQSHFQSYHRQNQSGAGYGVLPIRFTVFLDKGRILAAIFTLSTTPPA